MSEEIDILQNLDSMDLTNVETGVPLIPEGLYEVSVLEAKTEPNKKKTGHNLSLKFGLTQPTTSLDGKAINPNFPLFTIISLVKTEKYDPRQNLAAFMECFKGTKAGNFLPVEQFIGMTGNVRVKIDDSPEFGKKNVIARYVKKA